MRKVYIVGLPADSENNPSSSFLCKYIRSFAVAPLILVCILTPLSHILRRYFRNNSNSFQVPAICKSLIQIISAELRSLYREFTFRHPSRSGTHVVFLTDLQPRLCSRPSNCHRCRRNRPRSRHHVRILSEEAPC